MAKKRNDRKSVRRVAAEARAAAKAAEAPVAEAVETAPTLEAAPAPQPAANGQKAAKSTMSAERLAQLQADFDAAREGWQEVSRAMVENADLAHKLAKVAEWAANAIALAKRPGKLAKAASELEIITREAMRVIRRVVPPAEFEFVVAEAEYRLEELMLHEAKKSAKVRRLEAEARLDLRFAADQSNDGILRLFAAQRAAATAKTAVEILQRRLAAANGTRQTGKTARREERRGPNWKAERRARQMERSQAGPEGQAGSKGAGYGGGRSKGALRKARRRARQAA